MLSVKITPRMAEAASVSDHLSWIYDRILLINFTCNQSSLYHEHENIVGVGIDSYSGRLSKLVCKKRTPRYLCLYQEQPAIVYWSRFKNYEYQYNVRNCSPGSVDKIIHTDDGGLATIPVGVPEMLKLNSYGLPAYNETYKALGKVNKQVGGLSMLNKVSYYYPDNDSHDDLAEYCCRKTLRDKVFDEYTVMKDNEFLIINIDEQSVRRLAIPEGSGSYIRVCGIRPDGMVGFAITRQYVYFYDLV